MVKLDIDALLAPFPKRLPVFPLSEVVLFPGAVLPLHIFEHRYRQMLEDIMEGDRLIALALLEKCDSDQYQASPPFYETVCVGRIIHHEALEDGRSNIALLGLSAGVAAPIELGRPYRTADVQLLDDSLDTGRDYEPKLLHAFSRTVVGSDDMEGLKQQLGEFLLPERIPAALVNTCALTAPILPLDKLGLLKERSIARRLDLLVDLLERPWQWN